MNSRAAGIVTNNTFAEFQAAMTGGGTVVFAASGTVTFTQPVVVSNATILLPGTNSVVLSANGSGRLFEVLTNG
ncbi:MAG TPA: hypothetical protein PKA41_18430, partial [Verrucomicrobiota bacterium]|nr:hypothetical protein [Verrucomicrobiota bacterium]